jgi:hypothetical protein
MVANSTPPEPATPTLVDTHPHLGFTLASSTEHASSLSGCTLCRYSSEIRTGCANERSSGSEEGVVSNHDPYSDHGDSEEIQRDLKAAEMERSREDAQDS